jgi:DNA-binding transcriptional ArsR family regulator
LDLKKLVASSCRQKILKELAKSKEINVMGLVRRINSTYNEVNRNLKILREEGIVMDSYFGRVRMIRLNREAARTMVLLQALKTLESENTAAVHS